MLILVTVVFRHYTFILGKFLLIGQLLFLNIWATLIEILRFVADSSLYFPKKLQPDLEILTITSFLEYGLGGSF